MSHGGKLAIGWIAVIQLVCALVGIDALLLDDFWPGNLINRWLGTETGRRVAAAALIYIGLVALCTWLVILFLPTTTKKLTLARSHSSTLTIDRKGVEHSLRGMLSSEYPQLSNASAKVKIYRNRQNAKVTVWATVISPSDIKTLEEQVAADAEHNLSGILGIRVKHTKVHLRPYEPGEEIEVV